MRVDLVRCDVCAGVKKPFGVCTSAKCGGTELARALAKVEELEGTVRSMAANADHMLADRCRASLADANELVYLLLANEEWANVHPSVGFNFLFENRGNVSVVVWATLYGRQVPVSPMRSSDLDDFLMGIASKGAGGASGKARR